MKSLHKTKPMGTPNKFNKSNNNGNEKMLQCMNSRLDSESAKNIPIAHRMAVKLNRIDHLKTISIPQRAQNLSQFPLWNEFPLDSKIPDYRSKSCNELYFSRGRLCQSLFKNNRQEFDLKDPLIHRSPFPMPDYTALHDPHAKKYFQSNKLALRQLYRLNLINENNEVICGLKNFNQFRLYLAELQHELVEEELKHYDELHNMTFKIQKASHIHDATTRSSLAISDLVIDKLNKARKMQEDVNFKKMMNTERNVERWEQRVKNVQRQKVKDRLIAAQQQMNEIDKRNYIRYQNNSVNMHKRKQLLGNILKKEIRREKSQAFTQRANTLEQKQLHEKQETDKFLAMQARDKDAIEFLDKVTYDNVLHKEEWIRNYEKQHKILEMHKEQVHAMNRAEKNRAQWIRRKYFDLWRHIIFSQRERINSPHYSTWKVDRTMKKTNAYLVGISKFDPHHNVFNTVLDGKKGKKSKMEGKNSYTELSRKSNSRVRIGKTTFEDDKEKLGRASHHSNINIPRSSSLHHQRTLGDADRKPSRHSF